MLHLVKDHSVESNVAVVNCHIVGTQQRTFFIVGESTPNSLHRSGTIMRQSRENGVHRGDNNLRLVQLEMKHCLVSGDVYLTGVVLDRTWYILWVG